MVLINTIRFVNLVTNRCQGIRKYLVPQNTILYFFSHYNDQYHSSGEYLFFSILQWQWHRHGSEVLKNTLIQEQIYFLLYNNVSGLNMARRYWKIPSSSFEVQQYPPRPSASPPDFRGYCPTSQDLEGILQYLLAMLRPLYHSLQIPYTLN